MAGGASPGGDLVGRERELAVAAAALGPSRGGGGLLFYGRPGVGRSALLRTAASELGDHPVEVVWLIGSAAPNAAPFAAFSHLLGGGDPALADGRLPGGSRAHRAALIKRSRGSQLILAADDAHLLDVWSAGLVYQMVVSGEALVAAAVTTGRPVPPPLTSLWKDEIVTRVDVEPLGWDHTSELALRFLEDGAPRSAAHMDGELAEALWSLCEGNPLYLRELVVAARRQGRAVADGSLWRLEGRLPLGPRLAELVDERLAGVDRSSLELMGLIARAGPVPLRLLQAVCPGAELADLEARGLVAVEAAFSTTQPRGDVDGTGEEGDPTVRATPAVVAEAVRRASAGRHCARLLGLADAATGLRLDPRCRARAVIWRLDGGEIPEGKDLLEASRSAARERDWDSAARLAAAAVAGGDDTEAVLLLTEARLMQGQGLQALDTLEHYRRPGSDGDADDRLAAELSAMAMAYNDPFAETDLSLRLSGVPADLEPAEQARYREALRRRDRRAQGLAARSLGWMALITGRLSLAAGRFREAAAALERPGWTAARAEALTGLAEAAALLGAGHGCPEALAAARPSGDRPGPLPTGWRVADGWRAAADGQVEAAAARMLGAAADAHDADRAADEILARHAFIRLSGATARAHGDELGGAERRLRELAEDDGSPLALIGAEHAAALRAVLGAPSNDRPPVDGASLLDDAAERYRALGFLLYAAETSAQASWAHTAAGSARRAAASAARSRFVLGEGCTVGGQASPSFAPVVPRAPRLTRRESEVAGLAASGMSSPAIATRLCVSVRTVDTHLARVYFKLGIGGRAQLASAMAAEEAC